MTPRSPAAGCPLPTTTVSHSRLGTLVLMETVQ